MPFIAQRKKTTGNYKEYGSRHHYARMYFMVKKAVQPQARKAAIQNDEMYDVYGQGTLPNTEKGWLVQDISGHHEQGKYEQYIAQADKKVIVEGYVHEQGYVRVLRQQNEKGGRAEH